MKLHRAVAGAATGFVDVDYIDCNLLDFSQSVRSEIEQNNNNDDKKINEMVMHADHKRFFASDASLDFDERVSQQVGVSLSLHEVHKFEGSEDR